MSSFSLQRIEALISHRTKSVVRIFVLLCLCASQLLALDVPKLIRWVTDNAGVLSPDQLNDLDSRLKRYEDTTSTRFAVLIIPSLEGEELTDFSFRVASENKMSKKDTHNAMLFLIVVNDRKMRMEVGYGLEGALTDALTKTIQDQVVRPYFKKGNYYQGILEGLQAAMLALKGEFTAENKSSDGPSPFVIIFFAFIFFAILSSIFSRRRVLSRRSGGGVWYIGGGGWGSGSGSDSGLSSSGSSFDSGGWSSGGGSFGGGGSSSDW